MKMNTRAGAGWFSIALTLAAAGACSAGASSESAGQTSAKVTLAECGAAAHWAPSTAYATGALVSYAGTVYRVVQGHTSEAGWTPDAVAALFEPVTCDGGAAGGGTTGGGTTGGGATGAPTRDGGSGGGSGPVGTPGSGGLPSGRPFVGYYQSWSDSWKASGAETSLARMPGYVNIVDLAFMAPDASYVAGSLALAGTHLDFPYDGPTLKDAVAALHASHPGTKVVVSVGGATLYNWGAFAPASIASFVSDFGLDGVALDYEPATPNCASVGGVVACPSDAQFVGIVEGMRAAMPRPALLSIAAWSVGAYGEGQWAASLPVSSNTGIALAVLKDPTASAALDLLNVMSYDASPAYDPAEALAAYGHYFGGAIAMGIEVPPEAWGGHVYTAGDIASLGLRVIGRKDTGLMLWSIQKAGPAREFATAICTALGLGDCTLPLLH